MNNSSISGAAVSTTGAAQSLFNNVNLTTVGLPDFRRRKGDRKPARGDTLEAKDEAASPLF
jgi:hypothetical protein